MNIKQINKINICNENLHFQTKVPVLFWYLFIVPMQHVCVYLFAFVFTETEVSLSPPVNPAEISQHLQ